MKVIQSDINAVMEYLDSFYVVLVNSTVVQLHYHLSSRA